MMKYIKVILLAALLSGLFYLQSQANPIDDKCPQFAYKHAPIVSERDSQHVEYVCHVGYAIAFDTDLKIPLYVLEKLTPEHMKSDVAHRASSFTQDDLISSIFQATNSDYKHSGYDRGHMAPAEDFTFDQNQENESFLYTNVVPQNPHLNRGAWKKLEMRIREMAKSKNVYVVTGIVVNRIKQLSIGDKVAVPLKMFKVVIPENETPEYHLFDNSDVGIDGISDLKSIQIISGITLE